MTEVSVETCFTNLKLLSFSLKYLLCIIEIVGPVCTTREEIETAVSLFHSFTQIISIYTTPNEFENVTITGHLDFCLRKTRKGKSHETTYPEAIAFEKFLFNAFSFMPTGKQKAGVFDSSGWKSVFKKLILWYGLLSTLAGLHSHMSYLLGLHIAANCTFPL